MLDNLSCADAILFSLIVGDLVDFKISHGIMGHDGHEYYEIFIDSPFPGDYDGGVTFYFLPDGSWDKDSYHYI